MTGSPEESALFRRPANLVHACITDVHPPDRRSAPLCAGYSACGRSWSWSDCCGIDAPVRSIPHVGLIHHERRLVVWSPQASCNCSATRKTWGMPEQGPRRIIEIVADDARRNRFIMVLKLSACPGVSSGSPTHFGLRDKAGAIVHGDFGLQPASWPILNGRHESDDTVGIRTFLTP